MAGRIQDKDGGVTAYSSTVTVTNVAPTVSGLAVPTEPVSVDILTTSFVDVAFSDPAGVLDEPYTCEFDFDSDGVVGPLDLNAVALNWSADLSKPVPAHRAPRVSLTTVAPDKPGKPADEDLERDGLDRLAVDEAIAELTT